MSLVEQALLYEGASQDGVCIPPCCESLISTDLVQILVIAAAEKFLILTLVVSHARAVSCVPQSSGECLHLDDAGMMYLENEVNLTLRILLEESLKGLLNLLQSIMSRQQRKDWPAMSFALCLMLFGIESLQVDIHLRCPEATSICNSMDETAILMLLKFLLRVRRASNP